jgi:hypothetical protein
MLHSRKLACDPRDAGRLASTSTSDWCRIGPIDATDNLAVAEHAEIIVVPLAGWPTKRRPLQEQIVFFHQHGLSLPRLNSHLIAGA